MSRLSACAALIAAVLSGAFAAPAAADCQCLANGTAYKEGDVACLRLPTGDIMARCSKVLNNTSWSKVGDGCPEARDVSLPSPDLQSHPAKAEHKHG